ncbi:MAG: lycopene cyclase domain-containing protein [Ignavibacteria bacterium]
MQTEYFIVLIISLAAPLILSFSKKMDFYKYPSRLVLSILLPFILFTIWDIFVTARGHWSFNPLYTVGFRIFGLPIEEILFFIVIPFCGLFTWESVKYFTRGKGPK